MKRKGFSRKDPASLHFTFVTGSIRSSSVTPNVLSLLLLWLFTLPAASPLIQPTLTASADGLLHLYRVVALEQAIRQGALFPRWLPDLAFGYGFPLFVFYAPLAYYLTAALSAIGLGPVLAQNASLGLALFVAGTGVYFLVRDRFGPKAGLLAGVAYVYAPFQLTNALFRGGLPAAWALALYPLAFWALSRLIKTGWWRWLPVATLALGLAWLTHNTLTLLFAPLLVGYVAWDLIFFGPGRARRLWLAGLAWLSSLGLAAFFLVPALVEQQFAQVQRVITSPDFDFRYHFVTLPDLLTLPPPANTGLLNPELPHTLGLAQLGLIAAGLLLRLIVGSQSHRFPASTAPAHRFDAAQRALVSFAIVALLTAVVMMLPLSRPLWEALPIIEFVQFPHRWLGPAALMLAVLIGTIVAALPERWGSWLAGVGITLIFLASLPLLYPRYLASPIDATLTGMDAYEQMGGTVGTTSFGEYLPVWAQQVPREPPALPATRLDPAYLPPGATAEPVVVSFNHTELRLDSPQPFQAVFHRFYFPGWSARLNGQSVAVAPFSERGLIRVDVPAGRQQLELFFQDTPVRRVANAISVGSLLGVLVGLGLTVIHPLRQRSPKRVAQPVPRANFSFFIPLTGLALSLIAAKLILFDHFDTPLKRVFDGHTVPSLAVSHPANFGDQIDLLGYDLAPRSIKPGETLLLTAYWQARRPLETAYSALVHLVDQRGRLYTGQDNLHPGGLPARQWAPWGFVRDPHRLQVPFGTPPGDYLLLLGLYQPTTWQRLPILAGDDSHQTDTIAIPVQVLPPDRPPTLAELDPAWPVEANFGPLRLLGATPERDHLRPNDYLRLALFWEVTAPLTGDYHIQLRLLPDQPVAPPTSTNTTNSGWSPGERRRDQHELWIGPDLPDGEYTLQLNVFDPQGQPLGGRLTLGRLATAWP